MNCFGSVSVANVKQGPNYMPCFTWYQMINMILPVQVVTNIYANEFCTERFFYIFSLQPILKALYRIV